MKISDLKDYKVLGNANTIPALPEKKKPLANTISDFFGAKGLTDLAGSQIAKFGFAVSGNMEAANRVQQPSVKEVLGSSAQFGANFLPGAGIGAGLVKKVAVGAGTGLAFDVGSKLQQDKTIPESLTPGIGTAVGAGLPIVGAAIKPVKAILGRLFKGLGSGLSGVSTNSIDEIIANPQKAVQISQQLAKSGNDKVLEENARQIINGVSSIRQNARKAFGEGLDTLASTDIQPAVFREQTQKVLDKYGSALQDGQRVLSNVEFTDPKNIQRASGLIDELSNAKLDGKSLRKLADDIENAAYKVATSDERLSFNVFIKDLSSGLKDAITNSTDKLDEINRAFSQDMQLAEAVQNIFGKVNFKNLPEVVRASQKLEGLFAQKGLAPGVVDTFLTKIGINPNDFRTSEAVRQISNKVTGANTKGLSIGEIIQQVTGAIVTPNAVKNLSILTGMAEQKLLPFFNQLKPAARNIVIQALLQANQENSQ